MADKNQWILDEFKLEFDAFGPNKGSYSGSVRFRNGHFESFTLKLDTEMSSKFLALIRGEMRRKLGELSDKLVIGVDACIKNGGYIKPERKE